MDANNLGKEIQIRAQRIEEYARERFPRMAGRKILRFIDGNFRAQGWQGRNFEPWKPNQKGTTILIRKGKLRRSFHQEVGPGFVRTWSDSPYARVHNRGFRGTVNVPSHRRTQYTASKVGTGRYTKTGRERMKTVHTATGQTNVRGYTRKMNIPRRQFMPESANDSPVLINSIKREVITFLKSIF